KKLRLGPQTPCCQSGDSTLLLKSGEKQEEASWPHPTARLRALLKVCGAGACSGGRTLRDLAQFAAPIHCPKGPPFGPARSRWEEDPGTAAATRGALGPEDGRRSPLTLVGWGGDGGCVHAAVCQGMGAAPGPRSRGRPPPGSGRGLELGAAGPGQQRRRRRWRGPRRAWGLAPPGAPPAQTRRLRPETHRPGRQRPEGDAAGVGAGEH
ncbi:collagen alpha-1(III) chain-like, partial [Alexandromys fortis]|uniref:collagen alpha-1(III) chain-like n=1 Tax=Alexandromys fortis TaxID=100897 RepID=UPI0021527B38